MAKLGDIFEALHDVPDALAEAGSVSREVLSSHGSRYRVMNSGVLNDVPFGEYSEHGRSRKPAVIIQGHDSADVTAPSDVEPPKGWEERGVDLLAWYEPYHFARVAPGRVQWGVFLRAYGVEVISRALLLAGVPAISAPQMAYELLLAHELGHFEKEVLVAVVELGSQSPHFVRSQVRRKNQLPGYGLAEEGLCNALARNVLPKAFRGALDSWLALCPPGYRDWRGHQRTTRGQSWGEVLKDFLTVPQLPWAAHLTPGVLKSFSTDVPTYLILDGSGPNGEIGGALTGAIQVNESEQFWKDIRKSGNVAQVTRQWASTKRDLSNGVLHASARLKSLRGLPHIYSVRLTRSTRAALKRNDSGDWMAVMVDQDHDALYERVSRSSFAR